MDLQLPRVCGALAPVIVVLIALVGGGCGRKADPMPPVIEVPETTTDLEVRQEGSEAVLDWSFPQLTRAGRRLVDLERVEVWKLDVPPGQEQVGGGPSGAELRRQLMLGRGRLIGRLEGKGLEQATRGPKLEVRDPLPPIPAGQVAPTFWYAVRTRRRDGTPSALSNIAVWQVKPVPQPVQGLTAQPTARGISLTWQELPECTYQVERFGRPEPAWKAVSEPTLAQASFVDTTATQNASWRYRVRAVKDAVWGPPGKDVPVAYPDVYPPAAVERLVCLPEGDKVLLRWDPLAEPKVLYRVFRRRNTLWIHLVDDAREPRFVDTTPPAGDAEYAVKAVDAAGNESEPVYCTVRGER
ncbi:MAG TPA: fibronectin type III domain-containing protein [Thermoanaerobaculaceae bacterium]|nr:fibronectin type III domain-containing protein [Thermoanaerobaculaceae bacterium]